MASANRPLSPHLQVYKPQLTSVLSITHRGTGIFLSLGALFLSYWLLAIASGPEAFAALQTHVLAWYGQLLLYAFIFSLYYHLFNGIRHLVWDAGVGFEIKTSYISGYAVVIATVLFTILTGLIGGGA